MAFSTQKDFLRMDFINDVCRGPSQDDGKGYKASLKTYSSCTDSRAWSLSRENQTKYLQDLVSCGACRGGYYSDEGRGDGEQRPDRRIYDREKKPGRRPAKELVQKHEPDGRAVDYGPRGLSPSGIKSGEEYRHGTVGGLGEEGPRSIARDGSFVPGVMTDAAGSETFGAGSVEAGGVGIGSSRPGYVGPGTIASGGAGNIVTGTSGIGGSGGPSSRVPSAGRPGSFGTVSFGPGSGVSGSAGSGSRVPGANGTANHSVSFGPGSRAVDSGIHGTLGSVSERPGIGASSSEKPGSSVPYNGVPSSEKPDSQIPGSKILSGKEMAIRPPGSFGHESGGPGSLGTSSSGRGSMGHTGVSGRPGSFGSSGKPGSFADGSSGPGNGEPGSLGSNSARPGSTGHSQRTPGSEKSGGAKPGTIEASSLIKPLVSGGQSGATGSGTVASGQSSGGIRRPSIGTGKGKSSAGVTIVEDPGSRGLGGIISPGRDSVVPDMKYSGETNQEYTGKETPATHPGVGITSHVSIGHPNGDKISGNYVSGSRVPVLSTEQSWGGLITGSGSIEVEAGMVPGSSKHSAAPGGVSSHVIASGGMVVGVGVGVSDSKLPSGSGRGSSHISNVVGGPSTGMIAGAESVTATLGGSGGLINGGPGAKGPSYIIGGRGTGGPSAAFSISSYKSPGRPSVGPLLSGDSLIEAACLKLDEINAVVRENNELKKQLKYSNEKLQCICAENNRMKGIMSETSVGSLGPLEEELKVLKARGNFSPENAVKVIRVYIDDIKAHSRKADVIAAENESLKQQLSKLEARIQIATLPAEKETSTDINYLQTMVNNLRNEVIQLRMIEEDCARTRNEYDKLKQIVKDIGSPEELYNMKKTSAALREVKCDRDRLRHLINSMVGIEDDIRKMRERAEKTDLLEKQLAELKGGGGGSICSVSREEMKNEIERLKREKDEVQQKLDCVMCAESDMTNMQDQLREFDRVSCELHLYKIHYNELINELRRVSTRLLQLEPELEETRRRLALAETAICSYEKQMDELMDVIRELSEGDKNNLNGIPFGGSGSHGSNGGGNNDEEGSDFRSNKHPPYGTNLADKDYPNSNRTNSELLFSVTNPTSSFNTEYPPISQDPSMSGAHVPTSRCASQDGHIQDLLTVAKMVVIFIQKEVAARKNLQEELDACKREMDNFSQMNKSTGGGLTIADRAMERSRASRSGKSSISGRRSESEERSGSRSRSGTGRRGQSDKSSGVGKLSQSGRLSESGKPSKTDRPSRSGKQCRCGKRSDAHKRSEGGIPKKSNKPCTCGKRGEVGGQPDAGVQPSVGGKSSESHKSKGLNPSDTQTVARELGQTRERSLVVGIEMEEGSSEYGKLDNLISELEKRLKECQMEKDRVIKENDTLRGQISNEDVEDLLDQLNACKRENQRLQGMINEGGSRHFDEVLDELNELRTNVNECEDEKKKLKERLQELEKLLQAYKNDNDLYTLLQEKQGTIDSCQARAAELEKQVAKLTRELEDSINKCAHQVVELKDKLSKDKIDLDQQLDNTITRQEDKHKEQTNVIDNCQHQLDELKTRLMQEIEKCQKEKEEMQEHVSKLNNAKESLVKAEDSLVQDLSDIEQRLEQCMRENQILQKERDDLANQFKEAKTSAQNEINKLRDEMKQKTTDHEREKDDLSQKLVDTSSIVGDLRSQLEQQIQEGDITNDECEKTKVALRDLQEKYKQLESRYDSLQQHDTSIQKALDDLRKEYEGKTLEWTKEINEQKGLLEQAKSSLETQRAEISRLNEVLKQGSCKDLEDKLAEMTTENNNLKAENDTLRESIQAKEKQAASVQETVQNIAHDVSKVDEQLKAADCSVYIKEIDELKGAIVNHLDEIKKQADFLDNLKKEVDAAKLAKSELESELAQAKSDKEAANQTLRDQIDKLQKDLEVAKSTATPAQDDDEMIKCLAEQKRLQEENKRLQDEFKQLEDLVKDIESERKKNKELEGIIAELEQKIKDLQNKPTTFAPPADVNVQGAVDKVKDQLQAETDKNNNLGTELQACRVALADAQKKLEETQKALQHARTEMPQSDCERELSICRTQLDKAKEDLAAMRKQLEQTKLSMGQTGEIIRTSSKGEVYATVPVVGGSDIPSPILKIPSFLNTTGPGTKTSPDQMIPTGDNHESAGPLQGQQNGDRTGRMSPIDRNSSEMFSSTINEIRASHCENLEKMQKMYEDRMQEMMKNHDREIESLRMTNEALRNMLQDIKAQIAALGGTGDVDANKLEKINKELDSEVDVCGQDKKLNKICMKIIKTSINCLSLRELKYLHCAVYRAGVRMKPTSIVHSEDINRCCECTGFICCLPSIPKDAEKKFIERINCLENELENANGLLQRLRDRYESKSGCNRRCCTGHSERKSIPPRGINDAVNQILKCAREGSRNSGYR